MKKLFVLALLVVVLLFAAGCTKVTGGGWIPLEGGGKATFGFNMDCDPDTGDVKGHISFNDHAGVRFNGDMNATTAGCTGEGIVGSYVGTYMPKPHKGAAGGTFLVTVTDNGEPGPTTGDTFYLLIFDGDYAGYELSGVLGGGNIQAH